MRDAVGIVAWCAIALITSIYAFHAISFLLIAASVALKGFLRFWPIVATLMFLAYWCFSSEGNENIMFSCLVGIGLSLILSGKD